MYLTGQRCFRGGAEPLAGARIRLPGLSAGSQLEGPVSPDQPRELFLWGFPIELRGAPNGFGIAQRPRADALHLRRLIETQQYRVDAVHVAAAMLRHPQSRQVRSA